MKVYFIRVQGGVVIEKGWTDAAAFAAKPAQPGDLVTVTKAQHDAIKLGDPAP
jgi:hypothetical protein